MKRTALLVAAFCFAALAQAQLYKYVDKDGKTVYSDQPPPNVESKQLNISSGRTTSTPTPAGGPRTAVERDKELEKGRKDAREAQDKAGKAAQKADDAEKNCAAARSAYQTYAEGGRLHKYNEKGERVFLGDTEIDAERDRTRREMEEACKKS